MSNLSESELRDLGLASVGHDVCIDRSARIFGAADVSIGSHVRIDCFSVITAGPGAVVIGDHVHLGVGVCLFGTAGVEIGDFASLSAHVSIYSTNDDFTDGHLTGPTIPPELRHVHAARVILSSHALVGTGSVILPGVRLERGAAVGALSLVRSDVPEGEVAAGVPARGVGRRNLERLNRLEARIRAVADG
jgi:acetyltransferase-like isoleucine patch superfamily enzyme